MSLEEKSWTLFMKTYCTEDKSQISNHIKSILSKIKLPLNE